MTPTFYYNAEDELVIAKFPEDFADFLSDAGYENDARDFLVRWKQHEQITPPSEVRFDAARELAEEYANVVEIGDESNRPASKTYEQVFHLLRDLEASDEVDSDDEPIPWDREGALVNRFIADMPHEAIVEESEKPTLTGVSVVAERSEPFGKIVLDSVMALVGVNRMDEARELMSELEFILRNHPHLDDVIDLICHYVDLEVA